MQFWLLRHGWGMVASRRCYRHLVVICLGMFGHVPFGGGACVDTGKGGACVCVNPKCPWQTQAPPPKACSFIIYGLYIDSISLFFYISISPHFIIDHFELIWLRKKLCNIRELNLELRGNMLVRYHHVTVIMIYLAQFW